MTLQQTLFIIFGALTLGSALQVVTQRNLFYAALFLTLTLFGVAGLYVLLEAPFMAAVQLIVYVSGIAILIVLAIMVTRDLMHPDVLGSNRQWWGAALVSIALCVVLSWMVMNQELETLPGPVPVNSISRLGSILVDPGGLVVPFEVASILLLVAFIGAVTIARER